MIGRQARLRSAEQLYRTRIELGEGDRAQNQNLADRLSIAVQPSIEESPKLPRYPPFRTLCPSLTAILVSESRLMASFDYDAFTSKFTDPVVRLLEGMNETVVEFYNRLSVIREGLEKLQLLVATGQHLTAEAKALRADHGNLDITWPAGEPEVTDYLLVRIAAALRALNPPLVEIEDVNDVCKGIENNAVELPNWFLGA